VSIGAGKRRTLPSPKDRAAGDYRRQPDYSLRALVAAVIPARHRGSQRQCRAGHLLFQLPVYNSTSSRRPSLRCSDWPWAAVAALLIVALSL